MSKKKKYERLIDEDSFDPSQSAARGLDSELGKMDRDRKTTDDIHGDLKEHIESTDEYGRLIRQALEGKRTAAQRKEEQQLRETNRAGLRVLMITSDRAIFEDGSEVQSRFLTYAETFSELHVIVLTEAYEGFSGFVQHGSRMWVYPTHSESWFRSMYDAYKLAKSQVSFVNNFRADIIIAGSPYEEAIVGSFLARKFKRTLLIEVFDDPYDPYFLDTDDRNRWRYWFMRFSLGMADCIRTDDIPTRNKLVAKQPKLREHTTALRFFHNLTFWRDSKPTFDLKERYSQFNFIFLAVAALRSDQHVDDIVRASAPILRQYPSMGLVILGEGTEQHTLEKLVLKENLRGKVVLERGQDVTVSHLKTADVLINAGVRTENQNILYKAAAAGIPVVTVGGVEGGFVFIDGESACIYQGDDEKSMERGLGELLSSPGLRQQFSEVAQRKVFELYARDRNSYYTSYRGLCETCVLKAADRLGEK